MIFFIKFIVETVGGVYRQTYGLVFGFGLAMSSRIQSIFANFFVTIFWFYKIYFNNINWKN